ncbi:MAG TPA: hypothetical protein VKI99_14980 [Candidatus Dormibacteraeota bacterium]|nr:hypothetical protein [Candidatus Dormibacteraeota bacterium]
MSSIAARAAHALCYVLLYSFVGGLTSMAVANAVLLGLTTVTRTAANP